MQEQRYLKGKGSLLFWAFLVFLVVAAIGQFLQPTLLTTFLRAFRKGGFAVAYGIESGAFWLVYLCGMVGFLLAYGIKSTIRVHKIVFIVLAGFTLLTVAKNLLSTWDTMSRYSGANMLSATALGNAILNTVNLVLPLVASVAWISCMSVVAAGHHTGKLVRASATVLALTHLYLIVSAIAWNYLSGFMMQGNRIEMYNTIRNIYLLLNVLLQFGATAFFFATVSFGKFKQADIASSASQAGVPLQQQQ